MVNSGHEVVIEELLEGPEISILAFSDGYSIVPLPAAQDHKRVGEGDTGLNTGGMGAYAPAPVATTAVMDRIMNETLRPTIDGMRKEGFAYLVLSPTCHLIKPHLGFPFVGLLFTGLMLTQDGPKVLEYNVRFGDPETEVLMLLLSDDTDLAQVLLVRYLCCSRLRNIDMRQACAEHRLDAVQIKTRPGFSVSVILVSRGYPGPYSKGKSIQIGDIPTGARETRSSQACSPQVD